MKKINTTKKGYMAEKDAVDDLKKDDWETFKPQKVSRFGSQDIFRLYDICCRRGEYIRFIQVKSTNTQGFLKKLKIDAARYTKQTNIGVELWVRKNERKDKIRWKKYCWLGGRLIKSEE